MGRVPLIKRFYPITTHIYSNSRRTALIMSSTTLIRFMMKQIYVFLLNKFIITMRKKSYNYSNSAYNSSLKEHQIYVLIKLVKLNLSAFSKVFFDDSEAYFIIFFVKNCDIFLHEYLSKDYYGVVFYIYYLDGKSADVAFETVNADVTYVY